MFSEKLRKLSIPEEIIEALTQFTENLKKNFSDAEVYLFGSYAKGTWLKDSDIDLIVVSKSFGGLSIGERARKVRPLAPKNIAFELLIYTPEEFQKLKGRSIVLSDASEYWIRLL